MWYRRLAVFLAIFYLSLYLLSIKFIKEKAILVLVGWEMTVHQRRKVRPLMQSLVLCEVQKWTATTQKRDHLYSE